VTSAFLLGTSSKCSNNSESANQGQQQKDVNWLSVKSWSAKYQETYRSQKDWELTPEVRMSSTYESTVSGTYTLDVTEGDGEFYGEWYGYGSGSLISIQIVKMESDGPNGKIVITERTETRGSGAIGDPALNEYGEFWGGSLSIDIYTGTYSVGFGGPESNSKSTLTRTVEGIPTDYSELSKLPVGLREIFVPLGERAEEWATYSGPLEDAEGVMAAGMFGMDLTPDFEEPTEYELPENGTVLTGSYNGKNTTKSWTVYPSGMEMPEVFVEIMDKDWVPEEDNTVKVRLSWENLNPSEVEFTLFDISEEPGICLNSEDDNTDPDMDITEDDQSDAFEIEKKDKQIVAVNTTSTHDRKEAIIVIRSLDFGAHALIKARIKAADMWYEAEVKDLGGNALHLPFDENENHIADKWEKDMGIFDRNYPPTWDFDPFPDKQKSNGDGFALYEEYRGFIERGHLFKEGKNEQVKGDHVRTDPMYKDVFVYDQDGLFREHYAAHNPADLNWHYIDNQLMKYTGNVEDDENRWVNYRTSYSNSNQKQYAMWVRYWPVGGNTPFSGGESPRKQSCVGEYPGNTPLKCIYMVRVTQQGILNALSGIPDQSRKQRLFSELLTSTVIHEIGHGLGIAHHNNNIGTDEPDILFWNLGVKDCSMRYETSTEVKYNDKLSLLKTRYCQLGDTWIRVSEDQPQGSDPQEIVFETYPAHDCYWQINIKGD